MTRDDIIRMAREAGSFVEQISKSTFYSELERFAVLVAAAEREACAKLCDEAGVEPTSMYPSSQAKQLADAIRVRSQQ